MDADLEKFNETSPSGNEIVVRKSRIGRKGNSQEYIAIKQISPVVYEIVNNSPGYIKDIAILVVKALKERYPERKISGETIQKRVYDTTLVFAGVGILKTLKKVNYILNNHERQVISVSQEDLKVASRAYSEALDRVKEKRRIVNHLKKFAHNLSILRKNNLSRKNQICKEEESQRIGKKIFIERSLGILMPNNFSFDSLPILRLENYRSEFLVEVEGEINLLNSQFLVN